jgi:hypothetical protein
MKLTPLPPTQLATSTSTEPSLDRQASTTKLPRFRGRATFGDDNDVLVSAGGYDGFVARFDSEGYHLEQRRFGGTGDEKGDGVDVDPARDRVLVVGRFTGQTKIAGFSFESQGSSDVFFFGLTL